MTTADVLAPPSTATADSEAECYTCWSPLAAGQAYYRLRIGLDLAPNFHAIAPEHLSTVEEETLFCVCERCYADVSEKVDELLDWLWQRRPAQEASPIEPDVSKWRNLTGVSLFDVRPDARRETVLAAASEREDS